MFGYIKLRLRYFMDWPYLKELQRYIEAVPTWEKAQHAIEEMERIAEIDVRWDDSLQDRNNDVQRFVGLMRQERTARGGWHDAYYQTQPQ